LAVNIVLFADFHQLGTIDLFGEDSRHGSQVSAQPAGSELNAIRQTSGKIGYERFCGLGIALAECPTRNQFRININCRPGPNAPSYLAFSNLNGHLLLLAITEGPASIYLDSLAGKVAQRGILELGTRRPEFQQEFVDGVASNPCDLSSGAHRITIDQALDDCDPLCRAELVHIEQYA
jgi:hypothetical protein